MLKQLKYDWERNMLIKGECSTSYFLNWEKITKSITVYLNLNKITKQLHILMRFYSQQQISTNRYIQVKNLIKTDNIQNIPCEKKIKNEDKLIIEGHITIE